MTMEQPTPAHPRPGAAPAAVAADSHPPPPYISLPPSTTAHPLSASHHHLLPLPAIWLCGTCHAPHPIRTLLLLGGGVVRCACGAPSLRAVYDQFGRIFLYWRERDPAVADLRDPEQAREARGRVWAAGGGEVYRGWDVCEGGEDGEGDGDDAASLGKGLGCPGECGTVARRWSDVSE
ncbi:hypothetical protein VTK26DRAFT_1970 [Humicola hyalothermophila]